MFYRKIARWPCLSSKLLVTVFLLSTTVFLQPACKADDRSDYLRDQALAAAKRGTQFLTEKVATEGGYLWRYSADLIRREGEGVVDTQTVWVQPPATPTIGLAFVKLFRATGERQFLEAALAASDALRRGQMRSGGWQAMVEFAPDRRKKWAYRVDPPSSKAKDQSSLDDNKTQSALVFLIELDDVLKQADASVHEAVQYGLEQLCTSGQLPGGGFPQVWPVPDALRKTIDPGISAAFPDAWSRSYPGHQEYWFRPTLNDNLAPDVFKTLRLADRIYGDKRYRETIARLGDFLLKAQLPEPQPAWAQQYDIQLHPMWARRFEPPAVTGGESQGVIAVLMEISKHLDDTKYLRPIPSALDYLQRSTLSDGSLARFYELRTNRPLYFDREYHLTYRDDELPTHYGFKVTSQVAKLRKQYARVVEGDGTSSIAKRVLKPDDAVIRDLILRQASNGAWFSEHGLKYHKLPGQVIDMRDTAESLNLLADYLHD